MSAKRIRKRTLVYRDDPYRSALMNPDGSYQYDYRGRFRVAGTQITESEGHPWTNQGYKGEDIGGAFRTTRQYIEDDRGPANRKDGVVDPSPMWSFRDVDSGLTYIHHGPLYPINPNNHYPASAESSDAQLDAWGTKAIALCKPTNSIANLSEGIGEIVREGLPSLIGSSTWESRARSVKSAGSEYLNVQFGWLPLISEVRKAAYAARESDKILAQYERDAGRLVRRRFEFPLVKEVGPVQAYQTFEPFTGGPSLRAPHYTNWPLTGTQTTIYGQTETTIRRWFSGAFTYYLPTGYDSRSKIARAALLADKLYGVSVDPETLWNLMPWSWAADWVGNYGDVVSNVSDYLTDGLVLRYGYMMEHSIVKRTHTLTNVPFKHYGKRTLTVTSVTEVKKRRPATPFGFGLTYDGLSLKQKSILAALGMTKFR